MIRTLTAQLAELKRRHREEISALEQAIEAMHGRNLEADVDGATTAPQFPPP